MTMGDKILAMRKARGWSQEELAEHIGVTRQAVSRWESDSAKPDADKIIALCDLFGVSADYLLRDIGGSVPTLKPENELQKAIRTMPLRRWIGGIFTLFCGVCLMVLKVLSVVRPWQYYHYDGLTALLKVFGLEWIWYALWAGLVIGLWKAFSPKPLAEYHIGAWAKRMAGKVSALIQR